MNQVYLVVQAAVLYNANKLKEFCIETIVTDLWKDTWDFENDNNPIFKLNDTLQQEIEKAQHLKD